jgi:hypothetical protein
MSTGDKILIVGPAKAGKTAIANFLAKYPDAERAASPASTYTPTVGTRYDGRLADGRLEGDTAASLPLCLAASLPRCLAVSLPLSRCLAVSFWLSRCLFLSLLPLVSVSISVCLALDALLHTAAAEAGAAGAAGARYCWCVVCRVVVRGSSLLALTP